eukprot:GHVQ01005200.1.p1 GENE.GHVQ01005200.1~~GHVQ01005200.1.p1  ORF type:complete len:423 (+),score=38.32 GHVQ01005200.1:194-1462(+)
MHALDPSQAFGASAPSGVQTVPVRSKTDCLYFSKIGRDGIMKPLCILLSWCNFRSLYDLVTLLYSSISSLLVIPFLHVLADFISSNNKKVNCGCYLLEDKSEYWKGKVAWITGASSGIGSALARALAKHKVSLVLSARSRQGLENTKAEIVSEGYLTANDILVLPLELADLKRLPAAVKAATQFKGGINILFNNAGLLTQEPLPSWPVIHDIMAVNLMAPIRLCQEMIPHFKAVTSGQLTQSHLPRDCHIVFTNSVQGIVSLPCRSAYATSKHALRAYARALSDELSADHHLQLQNSQDCGHVAVTSVFPGYVRTALTTKRLDSKNLRIPGIQGPGHKGVPNAAKPMLRESIEGMSSEAAADRILTAVSNKRKEAWIGGAMEMTVMCLQTYAPDCAFRLVRLLSSGIYRAFYTQEMEAASAQ